MQDKNSLPLIEKYRAKRFNEIKGQELAVQDLNNFYKTFPKKRAIILAGPVGTGKTSLAIALANEYNLELFELNASDLRNKSKLDEVLGPALAQSSLFKKGKLILMDEADGITGTDRGGVAELITLIAKSSFPIVITANDIWDKKFGILRQKCKIINLKELKESAIIQIINDILEKEKRKVNTETINLIARKSRGDVRAALNDLQTVLNTGEDVLILEKKDTKEPHDYANVETIVTEIDEREKQESIFESLKKIFQMPTSLNIINAFDNVEAEIDEIILWVEENIPLEYQGQGLVKAFNYLSKADIFKGRIYRQQYWRFLVYESFFLTAGISSSTKLKYNKYVGYQRPSRILKIWLSNQKYAKKKSIIAKFSKRNHMSKSKAMKEYAFLPLILDEKAIERLDLSEDEIDYLAEKREALLERIKIK